MVLCGVPQATGLALPGADLDIVVLGVSAKLARAGSGFSKVGQHPSDNRLLDEWGGAVALGVYGTVGVSTSLRTLQGGSLPRG